MKNLKVFALALVITTGSLFASEIVPDIPVKEIRTQIVDLFHAPEFTFQDDLTVNIVFTFNSEGKIVVLSVDSKDPDVLNYVRKNLNSKTIDTPGEMNRVFTMPLRLTK
jgi:hypothetical protein